MYDVDGNKIERLPEKLAGITLLVGFVVFGTVCTKTEPRGKSAWEEVRDKRIERAMETIK